MFTLTIEAFADGGAIPDLFTCEGDDISPALAWSGEPEGTQSFALIMDDPDAPAGTWNHWLLWDIPARRPLSASALSSRPALFTQGRTISARPVMEAHVHPSAMVPIVTSFGFTRLIRRPWESLKALTERSWSVLLDGTGSASQNIWADSSGSNRVRFEVCSAWFRATVCDTARAPPLRAHSSRMACSTCLARSG